MANLKTPWMHYKDPSEVIPMDDLREHEIGMGCWCKPQETARFDIEHRAMDQRELYEDGFIRLH